jgi:beta-galactosidase beta subunit
MYMPVHRKSYKRHGQQPNGNTHRNYIDLQSVIKGREKIGVADVTKLTLTIAL